MRSAILTLAIVAGLGAVASAAVSQSPPSTSDYLFRADTGLLVFHVHREHAAEFEEVLNQISAGLRSTASPSRAAQAAGWRAFRARDTDEAAIYVVLVDPVVANADYDPVKMLTELAPTEAIALYDRLRVAVIRVERLDLDRMP